MKGRLIAFLSVISFAGSMALSEEWGMHAGSGGFMGSSTASISYKAVHQVKYKFGVGVTPAFGREIYQFNLGAILEPLPNYKLFSGLAWNPLGVGATLVYTPNSEFFLRSPSKYSDDGYYQPTNIHGLLSVSTQLLGRWDKLRFNFDYFVSIPHHYLVARFNNERWDSRFCCSSGFELSIPF